MTETPSIPTPKTTRGQTTKRLISAAVGLQRPAHKELSKDKYLTFKLRSNPTDESSTMYELTVPFFSSGTPEELLDFIKNVEKVFVGQNMTAGPARYSLLRRVLQGDALAAFNRAATATGNETNDHLKTCLTELKKHIFPRKALNNQKRYMRRFLRKPREMKIREFMTRLNEINELLTLFPPVRDGQEAEKLPDDKLMDIAEFAVPATWQKTMIMHGFDPISHSSAEFVEFCERIEFSEGDNKQETKSQADSKNGNNGGTSRAKTPAGGNNNNNNNNNNNRNRKRGNADKYCEFHGTTGHNTGECLVILGQAKKMRAAWEASRTPQNPRGANNNQGNLTWKRNDQDKKDNFKLELRDTIQEALKDMLVAQKKPAQDSDVPKKDNFNLDLGEFANLNFEEVDKS